MRRILVMAAAVLLATACSDDPMDPNGGNGNGNGNGNPTNGAMTATVDGEQWSAVSITAIYTSGVLAVGGSDATGTAIGIGGLITAPGTFVFGTAVGANGNVTEGGQVWTADGFQGAGSLTITTISAIGAVGTFSFTAGPVSGGAAGDRVVTNGTFNVTF